MPCFPRSAALGRVIKVLQNPRQIGVAWRCAKLLGPGPSSVEHGDLLYDERGLRK